MLKPNPTADIPVPSRPTNSTRFRPNHSESDARPHHTAVKNCAKVNAEARQPAWNDNVESGKDGSKDLSWKYMYDRSEVKVSGSDRRASTSIAS